MVKKPETCLILHLDPPTSTPANATLMPARYQPSAILNIVASKEFRPTHVGNVHLGWCN